jgi:hypothetical protein
VVQLDVPETAQSQLASALEALRKVPAITSVRIVELGKL